MANPNLSPAACVCAMAMGTPACQNALSAAASAAVAVAVCAS